MLRSRMLLLLLRRLLKLPRLARFDGGTAEVGVVASGCGGTASEAVPAAAAAIIADETESLDLRPRDAAVILVLLVVRFLGRTGSSCTTTPSPKVVGTEESSELCFGSAGEEGKEGKLLVLIDVWVVAAIFVDPELDITRLKFDGSSCLPEYLLSLYPDILLIW